MSPTSPVSLLTPILNGGIQNVNFVNGRVLTASDMTAERTANLQRQRLLGTGVGDGVAAGLEVTLSASSVPYGQQVVQVTAGSAVNRNGDVLQLVSNTNLALTAPTQTTSTNAGLFVVCQPPQTQVSNPGIYVLTIMPVSGYQGQVPVTQLNSGGVGTSCTSQYATAGVQFRMAPVTLNATGSPLQTNLLTLANQIQTQLGGGATAASVAPQLSQFQNGLAHVCFGTETLATYAANPFPATPPTSSFDSYGLIDSLRTGGMISDCEVPLAIIYWTPGGIRFVDLWSVRRPVFPLAASEEWPLYSGRRRTAEGLAMFLQFQDQLQTLMSASQSLLTSTSAQAGQFFRYLPPVGFLPISGVGSSIGVNYSTFLGGNTYRNPQFIEGAGLAALVQEALPYPPVDLTDQVMIWLYWVRENMQAINTASSSSPSAPNAYLVFASGQAPNFGYPHYDVNRWDYSTYA